MYGQRSSINVSEEDHDRLSSLKDDWGYTCKGLMLEGAKRLDSGESEQHEE
jgi:hypothetical protein